jgi:hypothetical protein
MKKILLVLILFFIFSISNQLNAQLNSDDTGPDAPPAFEEGPDPPPAAPIKTCMPFLVISGIFVAYKKIKKSDC